MPDEENKRPEELPTRPDRPDVTLSFGIDDRPTASDQPPDVAAHVEAAVEAATFEPVTESLVGRTIEGRYEVVDRVGAGGMGVVYKARQLGMDRFVAIKVLARDLVRDEHVVRRFKTEALAVSRLTHPNTIRVFDFGRTSDGIFFLAMEFLEGRSLADAIAKDGPLSARRTLHILRQVADSLSEAHQKGIIHRDLKPDNIFLTRVGDDHDFVKVLDFGVAKLKEGDPRRATMTQAGAIFGTPCYMAPEQCRSAPVDHRADLYALGVVAYEMLVGRPPFVADNPLTVLIKQVQEEPPPFEAVRPDVEVPPEVAAIVRRCLEKAPDARFKDAVELAHEVQRAESLLAGKYARVVFVEPRAVSTRADERQETPTRITEAPKKGRRLWWVFVPVVLALAGAALLYPGGTDTVVETPVATEPPPAPAPATPPVDAPRPVVTVRFRSEPPGATVFDGGKEIGVTPFEKTFEKRPESRGFTFRSKGFYDAIGSISLDSGGEVAVELSRIAAAPTRKAAEAKPPKREVKATEDGPRKVGELKTSY